MIKKIVEVENQHISYICPSIFCQPITLFNFYVSAQSSKAGKISGQWLKLYGALSDPTHK